MKNMQSRSKGLFRRILSMDDKPALPENPLLKMNRNELIGLIVDLQQTNLNLQYELTQQHERSNEAVRVIAALYNFIFGVLNEYIDALRHFKQAGNERPIPAMWFAARLCEQFEVLFDNFDMSKLQFSPNKDLLSGIYRIANRPLNPGSKIATFLEPTNPVKVLRDVIEQSGLEMTEDAKQKLNEMEAHAAAPVDDAEEKTKDI